MQEIPSEIFRKSIRTVYDRAMAAVSPAWRDETRRLLIETHLPLAHDVAGRFTQSGESREDLEQVGALALVRAIDRATLRGA